MWKLGKFSISLFNKYLNADLNWKRWTVAPRWGVMRWRGMKFEKGRKKKDAGTWWCKDVACILSAFLFKFSCEKSWNKWFNPFNKYLNHSLTGANNRRRDHRARTKKTQELVCDLFLLFPLSFSWKEMGKMEKDLREENTIFEKAN